MVRHKIKLAYYQTTATATSNLATKLTHSIKKSNIEIVKFCQISHLCQDKLKSGYTEVFIGGDQCEGESTGH